MTPGPGIEPGTHWWEASALTTATSLLPEVRLETQIKCLCIECADSNKVIANNMDEIIFRQSYRRRNFLFQILLRCDTLKFANVLFFMSFECFCIPSQHTHIGAKRYIFLARRSPTTKAEGAQKLDRAPHKINQKYNNKHITNILYLKQ